MRVAAALLEILRAAGVRHIFGNPGTTELAFLDALPGSGLDYVLALQEATAVAAADGYAQASGHAGVASVHVAPGVANGLAILHNAARARSPLLLTAGQQDSRLLLHEPILSADLVQLTEQFTKWSWEVRRPEEAPVALRRALKEALTPPTGPVFLSLPMDLMTAVVEDAGEAPPPVAARAPADPEAIARIAGILAPARAPRIVAGDGVARAGGERALAALAERLGARVHGEPIARRTVLPGDHPLWGGGLYPAPAAVRKALDAADAVLIVGATVFTWFLHAPGEPFPPGVPVVQVDDDARQIGRSHAVTLGVVADPRLALEALDAAVAARQDAAARAAAEARRRAAGTARLDRDARVRAAALAESERTPIAPAFLMATLAGLLPPDAVVVDESASSLGHVLRHLPFRAPGSFYGSKTGTLGWAAGAAVGVQLARPGRKVVATIGDGSLLYAPQALWTAAHRGLPITYVVPDNASYAILKAGMLGLGLDSARRGIFPGMDLADPRIDAVGLARALGVRAERVERPGELRDVLATCLAHAGPSLVDVVVDGSVKGET